MSAEITTKKWTPIEVFIFRLGLIFFIILSIPYDLNLYRSLAYGGFSFQSIFQLATFRTSFISESLYVGSHLEGYYNWLIALVVATTGAVIWRNLPGEKNKIEYNQLYYWLRVLLRYRLALAVIFTGIIKLVPIQIPEPTLSDLHTAYGEFLLWKVYYLTNAISSAGYVPFLGFLEILGGLLLLHKRTTSIGAGLLITLLLNVVLVNYVYEIGEQVYSSFLLLLASVIILYDVPRLYNLFVKESKSDPDNFIPTYTTKVEKLRTALQLLLILVITSFSILTVFSWQSTNYPFPKAKGIADIKGFYNVQEFVVKGDTIPYSLTDSVRWQNVVFEEWNTLSIKHNEPIKVDSLKPRIVYQTDNNRNYEQLGNGGRHFYSYKHKENDGKFIIKLINKSDTSQVQTFSLKRLNKKELLLKGININGDSLSIKLVRIHKKYLLQEGRRKPIKIY
nr:hypothetical protein [Pedobacter panaciterrae]